MRCENATPASGERPRILVIDDNTDVCAYLAHALNDRYDVSLTSDATDILPVLAQIEPELILLDHDMPGCTGIEVCRIIRADPQWQHVPVLFISAFAEGDRRIEFFAAGANDVIGKPFDLQELRARIAVWLSVRMRGQVLDTQNRELMHLSRTDPLTGLYNRHYALELLEREFGRYRRYGSTAVLLFIDIDNFKQVNDTLGHIYGDGVLRTAADLIRDSMRDSDVCIRYGGDEFLVLLPETNARQASTAVDRLQSLVAEYPLCDNPILQLGLSIGLSELNEDTRNITAWIDAADQRMYADKANEAEDATVSAGISRSTPAREEFRQPPTSAVLIADDEPSQRLILRKLLTKWGYPVIEAENGQAVLAAMAQGNPPRILLLDWLMPGLDGCQVCRTLRASTSLRPRPQIIMISRLIGTDDDSEAYAAGADAFLAKPCAPNLLRAALASASRLVAQGHQLLVAADDTRRLTSALSFAERQRAVGLIAAGIVHDFNNALSAVLGYSRMLLNRPDLEESVRGPLEKIEFAAQTSSQLTERLAGLSKKSQPALQRQSLSELIRKTIGMFRLRLDQNHIRLTEEYEDTPPAPMRSGDIIHVCLNLLINAEHILRNWPAREVSVHTGCSDGQVWCRIADSGPGIPPEEMERIFEPLYSTKGDFCTDPESPLRSIAGTGLGLSTSRTILEEHGGTLTADAEVGQGAIFTFAIPLDQQESQHETSHITCEQNHPCREERKDEVIDCGR